MVPQQEPFRFIDEIVELDDEHIVARYTFPKDADFYRGHFPGNPVTPGVILVETMAQAGVVAYGIYLYAKETSLADCEKLLTMFTDAEVEFSGMVEPGMTVTTTGRKTFFRRKKLRCDVEMKLDDGTVVCSGVLSGLGVAR
ncbi:MAG: beta-hydroxyacyl-ACP dehydratase [Deltaproteobacteria bacterium]|nr:beta-hydroxyacyl-ACP dehydratase [Deltaproteobacteria bacterium]MBW2420090.1 beta-hydroxyacyl-ACP dehydratase [Deltaproteobacteria bacterium]